MCFTLDKDGDEWHFINHLLQEEQIFKFGDLTSLSVEPLDFIGRHIQEDIMFLNQRGGNIYLDAGQLCFPGNWSLPFNLGRTFEEIHSPVPSFSDSGLARKAREFLMRIETGKPWTRFNWTITAGKFFLQCLLSLMNGEKTNRSYGGKRGRSDTYEGRGSKVL
ncbi:heme-dependent oxidative N-demethylase subunit alpha family protein [Niallia sp. 03133]|uniref:heme-dependent oxidative N-demethylase subunit alpha family protein n=1 Tax=Niallia sp. 03133 TaxID=3458060 RepID=UPI004043C5D3